MSMKTNEKVTINLDFSDSTIMWQTKEEKEGRNKRKERKRKVQVTLYAKENKRV